MTQVDLELVDGILEQASGNFIGQRDDGTQVGRKRDAYDRLDIRIGVSEQVGKAVVHVDDGEHAGRDSYRERVFAGKRDVGRTAHRPVSFFDYGYEVLREFDAVYGVVVVIKHAFFALGQNLQVGTDDIAGVFGESLQLFVLLGVLIDVFGHENDEGVEVGVDFLVGLGKRFQQEQRGFHVDGFPFGLPIGFRRGSRALGAGIV